MIRIAHEAPKSIFKNVAKITDYSYALVHLFEEDPEYYELFKGEKAKGREIILDNSIFELGTAFDADEYFKWVVKLDPSWVIIPDALEDQLQTEKNYINWVEKYPKSTHSSKTIAVIQGKTYEELVESYKFFDKQEDVDMIGISFDYSYYEKSVPHSNKLVSWMLGRVKLIGDLLKDGVLNPSKKHHLLGASLVQEGEFYKNSDYSFIYSMDTSNPVVCAIKGIDYTATGLYEKPSQKLYTLINLPKSETPFESILKNIEVFRNFWNE